MRLPALILAALMSSASLQAAQRGSQTPPPAPPLELTEAQQTQLSQALVRGRALAVLLQASRVSTRDMLVRLPVSQRGDVVGWIALPEGNGVTVTYFGRQGSDFVAIYRGQVLGDRVATPQIFAEGSGPPLTGAAARMAAARMAAEAAGNHPCGGDTFNTVVLPAEGDAPIIVYEISPRTSAATIPTGGHFRVTVAPDGSVAESTPLATTCGDVAVPATPAGQRPAPVVVNARNDLLPNEAHVFLSIWSGHPIVVATGTDRIRLWGVQPGGIRELSELHQ
jgi:hypothetical protein